MAIFAMDTRDRTLEGHKFGVYGPSFRLLWFPKRLVVSITNLYLHYSHRKHGYSQGTVYTLVGWWKRQSTRLAYVMVHPKYVYLSGSL
jgi:hypothetical protein